MDVRASGETVRAESVLSVVADAKTGLESFAKTREMKGKICDEFAP